MQSIIIDNEIKKEIISSARSASKRILLFSAYCKEQIINKLCESAGSKKGLDAVLVVRWQMEDLVNGASDLSVYEITKQSGWKMYINNALHAKIFIFDDKVVLGSANLTNQGTVGQDWGGNIEVCVSLDFDSKLEFWSQNIINNSCLLYDELYASICKDVEEARKMIPDRLLVKSTFSSHVQGLIQSRSSKSLYTRDLFWLREPGVFLGENNSSVAMSDIDHDLSLLGLKLWPVQLESLKSQFECSKAFLWLQKTVGEEIYFGELTVRLHDALQDDPSSYRKDVKTLLQHLINWIHVLSSEKFMVDRPRHSQRIRSI